MKKWKLPYTLEDGRIDVKRLPKAIQATLSNYRGARVSSEPEKTIPDVIRRLTAAAEEWERYPIKAKLQMYMKCSRKLKQVESS